MAPRGATFTDDLARWLAAQHGVGPVVVDQVERPTAGYSSITTMVRARWQHDGQDVTEHLVVRMAPETPGTFADYDLTAQHAAQQAAAAAGVPVASPLVTETDLSWLGAPFTVMPRIRGHVIGEAPPFDAWLGSLGPRAQAELYDNFLTTLAQVHRAEPSGVPARDDAAELRYWDEYLQWSSNGDPLPALVEALEWCRTNTPEAVSDPVLRWGDVRLGNVVFGDDLRPRAVLDWDMAAIGPPEHDVAWFTMLDAVLARLSGRRVEGFPDRDGTIQRYEELTGRTFHAFDWYETVALLRSTAIMIRILHLKGEPIVGNPLVELLQERTQRS